MINDLIANLFANVAEIAFGHGLEVSLELKDCSTDSNVLGGAFTKSVCEDHGLVLRAYATDVSETNDERGEGDE